MIKTFSKSVSGILNDGEHFSACPGCVTFSEGGQTLSGLELSAYLSARSATEIQRYNSSPLKCNVNPSALHRQLLHFIALNTDTMHDAWGTADGCIWEMQRGKWPSGCMSPCFSVYREKRWRILVPAFVPHIGWLTFWVVCVGLWSRRLSASSDSFDHLLDQTKKFKITRVGQFS